MTPTVIEAQREDDRRDVVHRAVQALAEGQVIAFPTDAVYALAASALSEAAVRRVLEIQTAQNRDPPCALSVRGAEEALDYAPLMSKLGQRLTRRGWPGPLTIQLDASHADSLVHRLPESARSAVAPNNQINLRVPDCPLLQEVQRMLIGPVVLSSVGDAPVVTAAEAVQALGDQVPLVLDDGPCRYGQAETLIRVNETSFQTLRLGAMAEPLVQRMASVVIVFVCTGNTCRSPMAEAMCRALAADRIGCDADQLEENGVVVLSAGVSASSGGRASPEAVEIMRRRGVGLDDHCSQPLTETMVEQADFMLVMTNSHRQAILSYFPEAKDRVVLLCRDQADVSDPIGGPLESYQRCADQIESNLKVWIEEWEFSNRKGT
ncbi:MAG: Sua5/YciO/YrdC/YwlC family protein, partial [Planctomycetales bacterium]